MPDMNFLYGQGERKKFLSSSHTALNTYTYKASQFQLLNLCIAGRGVLVPEPFSFRGAGSKSCQARPVWPCKETGPDVFLWKDSVFSLLLPVAFIAHIVQTTQLWLLHARSSLEVLFKLYYMWYIFIPRALPAVLVMAVVVLACALLSCWPRFDLLQWMVGRISSKLRNHFLKVQRCIVPSDYLIII